MHLLEPTCQSRRTERQPEARSMLRVAGLSSQRAAGDAAICGSTAISTALKAAARRWRCGFASALMEASCRLLQLGEIAESFFRQRST